MALQAPLSYALLYRIKRKRGRPKMGFYCDMAIGHAVHGPYHDGEYGVPVDDEATLFERFCLEIFQAGLSWEIVLRKRAALYDAFDGFVVDKVAAFDQVRQMRLLDNPQIIRNRLKTRAIIENARRFQALRATHQGFSGWLAQHHPMPLNAWVVCFKKTFVFTGPEIVHELLMSIGYLPGAHRSDCPCYAAIAALDPPWMRKSPATK